MISRPDLGHSKDCLHVPFKKLAFGSVAWLPGCGDRVTLACVELVAVSELAAEARTHMKSQIWCDSEIPLIKHRVYVRSKEHSIIDTVLAALGDRNDMGSLKRRNDLVTGDGTTLLVGLSHQRFESTLSQPGTDKPWFTKDRPINRPNS